MRRSRHRLPALLLLCTLPVVAPEVGAADEQVDFVRDVRPLLARACLRCHGPDKQKADLRLDLRATALAAGDLLHAPIIVPGDAASSELYLRLIAEDPEDRMPAKKPPLPAVEIDLLRRWIDQGAVWPDDVSGDDGYRHWSYQAPTRSAQPAGGQQHPVDALVSARLAQEGLDLSEQADRATLIRRLCLDLTGLPPDLDEVDAFVADTRPDAYERLVDRLLASPHYGEQMARTWLDLARYADSDGYEKDERRTMWRYRDWVIDAFNRDMPFDRFSIEQLAGDLLPEPTLEQRIATGFHRNTMTNKEGGVDPEEYRNIAVLDRVNTTASVWLGATLECAQCHDHKFDPFSHRDYYSLFAFFNNTVDTGSSSEPKIEAPTGQQLAARPALLLEKQLVGKRLSGWSEQLGRELSDWESGARQLLHPFTVLAPDAATAEGGSRLALLKDDTVLACGPLPDQDTYVIEAPAPFHHLAGLRLEVLTDPSLPEQGPGRPSHANFVLSEMSVTVVDADGNESALPLELARADHSQENGPYPASAIIDGDPASGWAVGGATGHPHQVRFSLAHPRVLPDGARLRFRLSQQHGSQHLIGRLRLAVTGVPLPAQGGLLRPDLEQLVRAGAERSADQESALRDWFRGRAPSLDPDRARLVEIERRLTYPTALVLEELDEPRPTFVLAGANFLNPQERVEPDVPSILGRLAEAAPKNRLGLARWLVDESNPLTARVTVNRLWSQLFGTGLVASLDDFGSQGDLPSHPVLLDWLATEFMERDWSIKEMMRLMVLSDTYRQSSLVTAERLEIDPGNRLLSRGSRHRLQAESLRDAALAISGRLSRTLGGPSVFPPQPEGTWAMTYNGDRWDTSGGPERYRRGLYTFWRRTAPYPTYMLFDAPSREVACAVRERSNTPLQALALLNDPVFSELAGGLARRMLDLEGVGLSDEQRIARGFRWCTSRIPEADEVRVLCDLLERQLERFRGRPAESVALAEWSGELGEDVDRSRLAAWTVLANTLLNLDETVTRS